MILTILVIFLMLSLIFSITKKDDDLREVLSILCIFITGVLMVCSLPTLLPCVSSTYERTIDEKIALYEQENAMIEANINAMVCEYMQYESSVIDTYAPSGNAMTMVMVYPELKADTLVQKQIEIMTRNNEQIKALKEEKINISKNRWLLYFGN